MAMRERGGPAGEVLFGVSAVLLLDDGMIWRVGLLKYDRRLDWLTMEMDVSIEYCMSWKW